MSDSINFESIINQASQLPLVKINRREFLIETFAKYCSAEMINDVIEYGPVKAGLAKEKIHKAAEEAINFETTKVTLISAAAGVPGGFTILATASADLVQFYGHLLRITQKLAYLYGYPDLTVCNEIDDSMKNLIILFLGVMSGVQVAESTLAKITASLSAKAAKQLPRMALTKGFIYPIVKQVAKSLGVRMTKEIFAKGVSKVIPIIGGVVSGTLTFCSFKPMSNRLHKHLHQSCYSYSF